MNDLLKPYSFLAVALQLCPSYLYWTASTCFYMKQHWQAFSWSKKFLFFI